MSWEAVDTPENAGRGNDGWALAGDGTFFVAGLSGVWAHGPSARQTAGTIECPVPVGPTFHPEWDRLSKQGRADTGCPTGPEQPVSIEERISPNPQDRGESIREYRTSESAPWRIEAIGTPTYSRIIWRRPLNERVRVAPQEPRIVSGVVQWTEQGGFLRLERWDGQTVTLITGPNTGDERQADGTSLHFIR
jgi:hypothetical protein